MKILTDISFKEHCHLYTEIHSSIAIHSRQVGLTQKDIFLLSKPSLLVYKAGKMTGVTNPEFIKFTLSEGTYSIDDFNAKIKISILQQRQGWESPQIKDLNLVRPKVYLFMVDNAIFYALGIQDKYLEKTTLIRSTLPPGSYKTSLDTSPPLKILSLHCKQVNKTKNELDGQPSSLLVSTHVLNYAAIFSPTHLVFLELEGIHQHLDFKILDESNNEVIPVSFYLRLLSKE